MSSVLDRFKRYISVDTRSDEDSRTAPSTPNQRILAAMLAEELRSIGASNVRLDAERAYVYGDIPANTQTDHSLGFISHMDTAQEFPGGAGAARIVRDYDGGVINLCYNVSLDPEVFPDLLRYIGDDIVVTDGTTLLGADDKAGVSEIMTMAERLLSDPSIPHGKICVAFTSDEEIGRGTKYFDIQGFGADFAYTVDGGMIGYIEYENFNAATATVSITGTDIHPGNAKDVMVNAARLAAEFDHLLPEDQRPEHTEGYEGFFHLTRLNATSGSARMQYLIRDHDAALFDKKKDMMREAAIAISNKYGNCIQLSIVDSYRNMKEFIEPHMFLIDDAKAAFRACGIEPQEIPIRGGTDGARLSSLGLPCPNLSTGGHNFHSNLEYISVQSMEKMVDVLVQIARAK